MLTSCVDVICFDFIAFCMSAMVASTTWNFLPALAGCAFATPARHAANTNAHAICCTPLLLMRFLLVLLPWYLDAQTRICRGKIFFDGPVARPSCVSTSTSQTPLMNRKNSQGIGF